MATYSLVRSQVHTVALPRPMPISTPIVISRDFMYSAPEAVLTKLPTKVDLRPKDVTITVDLSAGPHSAIILTTDLTAAYVHENSAYST